MCQLRKSLLSLDFPTDDFFALIRSCYEKRNFNSDFHRLTFALVGVATPSDLIQDERRTPFNIGKAIQLAGNGHKSTVNSVAFSPDGKTLASASYDSTIKLWNVATSKEISTLNGHKYSVNSVAFSPDGKTLASASDDNTIKLWSLDLDNLLARGCNYLKEYLATRDELRKKLCSGT